MTDFGRGNKRPIMVGKKLKIENVISNLKSQTENKINGKEVRFNCYNGCGEHRFEMAPNSVKEFRCAKCMQRFYAITNNSGSLSEIAKLENGVEVILENNVRIKTGRKK